MSKNWASRQNKSYARNFAMTGSFDGTRTAAPFKSVLCLPGFDRETNSGAKCVCQGIEHGYISETARIVGLERHSKTYQDLMAAKKPTIMKNNTFFVYNTQLKDYIVDAKFDMVYLDLMGCWSADLSHWMVEFGHRSFLSDAVLGVTLYRSPRTTPLVYKDYLQMKTFPCNAGLYSWVKKKLEPQPIKGNSFYSGGKCWNKTSWLRQDMDIIPIYIICDALLKAGKSFSLHGGMFYSDSPTATMTSVHFSRIRDMKESHELYKYRSGVRDSLLPASFIEDS